MESDGPIRVIVADDHPMFRGGLRTLISADPNMEVIAEAASGEEVIALAADQLPDVVVMDLRMPGINGIDATRAILRTSPHVAVLVVTMFQDDNSVFAAMRAGARGYLLKGADESEILRAVRAVANGEAIFGGTVAQRVLAYFAAPSPPQVFPELTPREREILDLVAAGRNNAEIAHELAVSTKTVRNHTANIFAKLQVADRTEALLRAREAGLGSERAT